MKKILANIRFIPILVFCFLYKKNDRLIMDVKRWCHKDNVSLNRELPLLLFSYKEFRNLFIYRMRHPFESKPHKIFCIWIRLWYRPESTLYIECPDIGGGFYIQHGFATYISAQRIGENCSINQQVTLGHNGLGGSPIIGDRCTIMCGAKVLGEIELGDCTRVGANAVVIRDYKRGHGTLVGVPAVPKKEISKEDLIAGGVEIDETLFD